MLGSKQMMAAGVSDGTERHAAARQRALGAGEWAGAERRRLSRIFAPPLVISGVTADVRDISLDGLCLLTDEPLGPGAEYQLLLTDGLTHVTTELRARVLWSSAGTVGLQWVDLSEDEERWLRQRFAEWQESFERTAQLCQTLWTD